MDNHLHALIAYSEEKVNYDIEIKSIRQKLNNKTAQFLLAKENIKIMFSIRIVVQVHLISNYLFCL